MDISKKSPPDFVKTEEKMICVKAETKFFESGKKYDVYKLYEEINDKNARRFVRGSDGIYDDVTQTITKFVSK